ncbi:MAG TPA: methyltransferase domain-containing protein [Actinokineospora sp.]|jgi:23S rRNA (guanine745-N1)-methyltransferase|nr:methyltransferase domain-containing protein [Actinokineospora sp.]
MLADVVPLLTCPHCGADLAESPGVLRCPAGHSFDVAKQGYVSLLRGTATFTGDTAAMVDARVRFLGAGHYAPITDAIAEVTPGPGAVIDVGAGTGHYLAAALDKLVGRAGLAVDVSKAALRRAARAHPLIGAIVCDAWGPLPVRDGAAGLTLSVFAPRNPAELNRVLDPGGIAVVVAPTARHLGELVSDLDLMGVEDDKQSRVDDKMAAHFTIAHQRDVEFTMKLSHDAVAALVGMGPNAFHAGPDLAARIAVLPDPLTVTGSVTVSGYRPSGR